MKKAVLTILILCATVLGARPASAWEDIVIETTEESLQQSVDRIAGPDHRGFSSPDRSYESENHGAASPTGGIAF
jgi:hypothetical protein